MYVPVYNEYRDESLTVLFYGYRERDSEGVTIHDVKVEELHILGHLVKVETLPEALQGSLLALADDLEDWKGR